MKSAELMGQTFGRLEVVGEVPIPHRRHWKCQCTCGNEVVVSTGNLKNGSIKSCGCLKAETASMARFVHGHNRGHRRTKLYKAWCAIKQRTQNPNDVAFPNYGGRGISMHPSWEDFQVFSSDVGEPPSKQHSIDRINNDGNYEPGNVRWATAAEQSRNTRRTVKINGMALVDFCKMHNLSYAAIQARLRRGIPQHLAISPLTGSAFRAMLAAKEG